MTKAEKIAIARELMLINTVLNALGAELQKKIEKIRKEDGRCVECGNDLSAREQDEGECCNSCYGQLQRRKSDERPPDELDFYRGR